MVGSSKSDFKMMSAASITDDNRGSKLSRSKSRRQSLADGQIESEQYVIGTDESVDISAESD